jgi:hypothetical protein
VGLTATEKPLSVRKCGEVPSVEDSGWVMLSKCGVDFRSHSLGEHVDYLLRLCHCRLGADKSYDSMKFTLHKSFFLIDFLPAAGKDDYVQDIGSALVR